MEPYAERRGLRRAHALTQKRRDQPRQHVPAPALRERRAAARVDEHPPVRQCDARTVPLEHENTAVSAGKAARKLCPLARRDLLERPVGQTREFAVVRRQNRHAAAANVQLLRAALQGVQAVGVQHHRLFHLPQKRMDELLCLFSAPKSGAERQNVAASELVLHLIERGEAKPSVRLRQRERHRAHALLRLDRPDALRHAEIYEPAARMHRRACRQIRCARIAHAAAED